MTSSLSDSFCGNSQFWNGSAITEHWYPRLSECFQQTALTYAPCAWLWLTAGFHLAYLRRHTRFVHLPTTWLHPARLIVALLLCVTSGVNLILPLVGDTSYPPSYYLSHSVWLITYALACLLMLVSRRSGVTSPCVVFLFWLFTLVSWIVPFYTINLEK
ncbi:hypothetical protein EGW08_000892, partial [Elysia chlorotica]